MTKVRSTLNILAIAIFTLTVTSSASAVARTWVSGVGDDINPCSRTAPCKSYAGAISKTDKDGEISTLDPGGYGMVTITKSITINGGGTGSGYGSILAPTLGTGVIINITDAADVRKAVRLDWLNINGVSTGNDGIRMNAGNTLIVENCVLDGFQGDGVELNYTAANTGTVLSVHNTSIRNCAASGIRTNAFSGGQIKTAINNVQIIKCGIGINQVNGTLGDVRDSVISFCSTGIQTAEPTAGSVANIDSTNISNNTGTGVNVVGTSRARIASCKIFQNGTSLAPAANVDSGGNNSIVGNTTNTAPGGPSPFPEN
jgi:hypothetical protein